MTDWIALGLVVLAAALLQASTGYGFSIVGTPFLLLIYPVHAAIQVNIILSLCISLAMIVKIREAVHFPLFARLVAGSAAGLVPGIMIYLFLDVRLLKLVVGSLIVILTILLILKLALRQTNNRDYLTGGISGFLTASIGIPGPPLLLYFSGIGTDKATLRSTTLAYYLFIYFVSLVMQVIFGGTATDVWLSSLSALPALILGVVLGQWLFKRVSEKHFKAMTLCILFFSGLYLLMTSW